MRQPFDPSRLPKDRYPAREVDESGAHLRVRLQGPWPVVRKHLWQLGEDMVETLALDLGCEILGRNWYTIDGELDLIVLAPDGSIRALEVRVRSTDCMGTPAESITANKAIRLRRVFGEWVLKHGRLIRGTYRPLAIDVVGIERGGDGCASLTWLWDVV